MRGFPKTIGVMADLNNLVEEYPDKVLAFATALDTNAKANAKVVRVVSGSEEQNNLVTVEMDHPNPAYKRLGFKALADIKEFIDKKAKPGGKQDE